MTNAKHKIDEWVRIKRGVSHFFERQEGIVKKRRRTDVEWIYIIDVYSEGRIIRGVEFGEDELEEKEEPQPLEPSFKKVIESVAKNVVNALTIPNDPAYVEKYTKFYMSDLTDRVLGEVRKRVAKQRKSG
jgi:hypothetical protein